jgi:hypothetical protein
MSKLKLQPNASGTGSVTLVAPNTNSDYTITLPAASGSIVAATSFPFYDASGTSKPIDTGASDYALPFFEANGSANNIGLS